MNPGNNEKDVLFSYEQIRKGVKEFLLKYSSPTSLSPVAKDLSTFRTVISLQQGSSGEKVFKELLQQNGWHGRVEFVSDHNNEHIDAMAASDYGISFDGQMVGQAAACHLPCMILVNMRMNQQYYHDWFNRWANNMNLIADKDIYPELIGGQAWFGKIADSLAQWYVTPKTRF